MKRKNNANKKRIERISLSRTTRLVILGLISILLLISAVNAFGAYQNPTTKKVVTPILHYDHNGQFDYTVYLKNNTVYDNKTTLRPGEGIFFKKLIHHVNASFTDTFQIDHDADISGNYTVDAIIQTSIWTKTYPLVPKTSFNVQGRTARFTTLFPVNCTYYEGLLAKISEETGMPTQSANLIIQCTVVVYATTSYGRSSSVFSPTINVSLNQKTLEFSKDLTSYLPGVITTNSTVTSEEVTTQRILWTALSLIFLVSMPLFMFITTSSITPENAAYKELRKIKKKYGEWIVETKTNPELTNARRIEINSLEGLAKVSEEIGKPILLYASPNIPNHRFYVLDEMTMYEYMFKPKEEKTLTSITNPDAATSGISPLDELKKKKRSHRLLFSDRKQQ
ncbi:MAG TPA: DUF5305 family protein [Candidatus Thermoplasmatota archaeon]|nr:DUF5305 family protein [Candidatus Thermoplasmatota archaeon]